MASKRNFWQAVSLAVVGGSAAGAQAQLKPEQVLGRAPIQPGVIVTMPTAQDLPGCKATEVTWPGSPAKGVVVTDAAGKKLRQFISTAGNGTFNIFSYYADGVESYRELITVANGQKPDQFRWLGINGGKWGIDANGDGLVDEWIAISPEELAQEVYAAVYGKDQRRLAALFVKDDDLKKMNVPAAEIERTMNKVKGAPQRLAATVAALGLTDKAKMLHATYGAPHTTAGDTFGSREDLVKHRAGAVLVEKGTEDKAALMFAVGEIVQVGKAWKVVEGPANGAPTDAVEENPNERGIVPVAIQPIVNQIIALKPVGNSPADVAKYQIERATLLEQCVAKTQGAEQYPWLKQLVDAYVSAIESDTAQKAAFERLKAWKDAVLKSAPNETHPFVVFRFAAAEFAVNFKEAKDADKAGVSKAYRETLEKFVKDYPASADAPEAVMRVAMAYEYMGKDGEAPAKQWYEKLAKDYAAHAYAAKAAGAVKRLGSEGQPFALAGTTFTGQAFNQTMVAGKPTVVYYWATWGSGTLNELKALGEMVKGGNAAMKGVQVVTCCLDDVGGKAAAMEMLKQSGLEGIHLYAEGGLDSSPLATAYGIQMVPHILLVDKDGKIANRNAQNGPLLKDEIEKMLK
jgi:hypothetical protein